MFRPLSEEEAELKREADADAMSSWFDQWCAENEVDPHDDDAWEQFRESEYERTHPYESRGLNERDFL